MHFGFEKSPDTLSDEEILHLSRSRPELFSILLSRYEEPFLRKAIRIMGDEEAGRDVVQDTFTKIYLNAAKYKPQPGASFKSWGYKILVNTAYTAYVKRKKDSQFASALDPELEEILADQQGIAEAERSVEHDYVVSVFSRMPRELARVLHLHFLDGVPHQEIAEQEGLSVPAVKTRVYRAKRLFRKLAGNMK